MHDLAIAHRVDVGKRRLKIDARVPRLRSDTMDRDEAVALTDDPLQRERGYSPSGLFLLDSVPSLRGSSARGPGSPTPSGLALHTDDVRSLSRLAMAALR